MVPIRFFAMAMLAAAGIGASARLAPAQAAENEPAVSAADKAFFDGAFSINQGEIMLGHLAEQKRVSQPVKTFAEHMVSDHTRSLEESKQVASKTHLTMPTTTDAATKNLYNALSKKNGRDFEIAYMDAMVSGHEAAVRTFDDEVKGGQNDDIKGYARMQLPMLRAHWTLARETAEKEKVGVTERQPTPKP